jgi:hypothetical protein
MARATASQASILREAMTTLAPCWASRRAIASPMPREAPVTIATLPARSNSDCVNVALARLGSDPRHYRKEGRALQRHGAAACA